MATKTNTTVTTSKKSDDKYDDDTLVTTSNKHSDDKSDDRSDDHSGSCPVVFTPQPSANQLLYTPTLSFASASTTVDFEDFASYGIIPTSYFQGAAVNPKSVVTNQFINKGLLISNAALIELGLTHAASGKDAIAGITNGKIDYDAAIKFGFVTKAVNSGAIKGNGNSIEHNNDQSDNHANEHSNTSVNDHSVTTTQVRGTVSKFSYTPDKDGASGNTITITGYDVHGVLLGKVSVVERGNNLQPIVLSGVGEMYTITVDSTLRNKAWGGIGVDDISYDSVDPVVTTVGSTHFVEMGTLVV